MKKLTRIILTTAITGLAFSGCTSSGTADSSGFNTNSTISVVSREDGSGTRGAFIELLGIEFKGSDGTKKDMTTKETIVANKTDVMITNIASDEYSIGYISLGSLNGRVKALAIDEVAPSSETVKDGTYKVARPFMIATKGVTEGLTKDFIDYILSTDGQAVVADSYISIDDNAAPYAGTKPSGKIVVAGSSSVTPIMEKLKEAYLTVNPNAVIEIQMSDSTAGMTGAIDGTCDIGMASRELKDSEKEQLTGIEIALDGIVVIVNNKNTAASLTSNNVKKIFTGEITKWNEVIQ